MSSKWVCKLDGTIQCDSDSKEITLEEMRVELESIIGSSNILNMEKRSRIVPDVCGFPTGKVNAYEITEWGAQLLETGFVGRQGFEPCSGDGEVNLAQFLGTSVRDTPSTIRELIGRTARVYKTGDALTRDWRPERVNIELNETSKVVDIWFG
jgi:hypothetical protein